MQRSIIIVGQGVRLGNMISRLAKLLEEHPMPFCTTKMAIDILPEHPLNRGMIGVRGNYRIPNDIEIVYVLGSSLSTMTLGYNNEQFAHNPKVIEVTDVDQLQRILVFGYSI